jgi:prolyl oligopeptidase
MAIRTGRRHRAGIGALVLIWLTTPVACTMKQQASQQHPPARRDAVVDSYHGIEVPDPYRWLEDLSSGETSAWIAAQNARTRRYVDRLPARAHFAARLRQLLDYPRFGIPRHEAHRYVYTHNSGMQEQDTLWVTDDPSRRGRLLIDPNRLRVDGTVSLSDYQLSPDGHLLAYALSDGGSDWKTWHIRDLTADRDQVETLTGTKFTSVAWSRDSRGFYYSRYPQNAAGAADDRRQVSIWWHGIGTDQRQDGHVFSITDHPSRNPYPEVTEDGRYLVIHVEDGYDASGLYYQRLTPEAGEVVRLLDRWDALYEFLGNRGEEFFIKTTLHAPRGRVVAIDTRQPDPAHWREVVPEGTYTIEAASMVGERLLIQYIVDARNRVDLFDLDGGAASQIKLPGMGTMDGFEGPSSRTETFFGYTDFTTPRSIFRLDVRSGDVRPVHAAPPGIRPEDYLTRQVWVTSRDGTRLPMFIVHRRDLRPDGRVPTVLYGYGGFNVSLMPAYSVSRAAWLEAGGVYAVANLRGGGEYGESWHRAGTRLNKQNVFDDFIAAAEWLVREGYTDRQHLAIWGGSNGGLLVGAVLNQRPELFAVAVPAVGVMDMLRYHTASANARQWSTDYGLSEVPEEFRALHAYSPYHNIRAGQCYPAVFVQADANDDRVVPWHSYKYAAALQHAQDCDNPVLIRIETRAGHGAGASLSKIVDEYADQWAFVAQRLGLEVG